MSKKEVFFNNQPDLHIFPTKGYQNEQSDFFFAKLLHLEHEFIN
jgi:hypothetical protein